MFPNPKFEQDLGCWITNVLCREDTAMELRTWVSSMLSDADTIRFTEGRWQRWDDLERSIANTHKALGTWGVKGKMSNFTFLIAGYKTNKIFLLHMNELTNEDKKKIQEGLDFDIERVNQNVSRLVWFTKV